MCFSAAVSFGTAALLVPAGIEALRRSLGEGRSELIPLAAIPFGFALQQGVEGLIWWTLGRGGSHHPWLPFLSLAYLFFAYALWPGWIAWCALRAGLSRVGSLRRACLWLLFGLGVLLGLLLWLPLLAAPVRAAPVPIGGSLHYGAVELLRHTPMEGAGPIFYLLVIALPLLLVPSTGLRFFGASLVVSAVLAHTGWQHSFSSVWCFFSAILSLQILWLLRPLAHAAGPVPHEAPGRMPH